MDIIMLCNDKEESVGPYTVRLDWNDDNLTGVRAKHLFIEMFGGRVERRLERPKNRWLGQVMTWVKLGHKVEKSVKEESEGELFCMPGPKHGHPWVK